MIQYLSNKFNIHIAWSLFLIFYLELLSPLYAATQVKVSGFYYTGHLSAKRSVRLAENAPKSETWANHNGTIGKVEKKTDSAVVKNTNHPFLKSETPNIGGPSSPEATSFKAAGADNLVNLFTGDFSYSIPLLDVGGYPVNLFYSGGIGMDQEASWVGLGWNINPGTVSRNMRGVPDDFNGTDLLTQTQNLKPNRTWGGELGADAELFGIKKPDLSLSLGFSYNNYLGPAIDIGARATISLETIKSEKANPSNLGISAGLGFKLSSRSGLTFSPSLSASQVLNGGKSTLGIGLSTSYNSRTGIKDITLNSQITQYAKHDNLNKSAQKDYKYRESVSPISLGIGSSSFSFARPSYLPILRMPMENSNLSGQIEVGLGAYGVRGSVTANGYYSESRVAPELRIVTKPLVGFMYSEKANANKDAVMDFNRVNDAEVTPNTPVISAPQYAYDIFSIQGEGTGGSIRAYRGDMGFMRDNVTVSKDKSLSIGADIAPPGHFGMNWNVISAPSKIGGWEDGNNTLKKTLLFKDNQPGNNFENVYFKNPGEATVTSEEVVNRIGGDNLVRFQLSGTKIAPRLESALEMYSKKNVLSYKGVKVLPGNTLLANREKRTQVTTMLTAKEATEVGLEKTIRSYTGLFTPLDRRIMYDSFSRVSGYRKAHHISEIDVLEQTGMRYVYGLPVYSIIQKDFTFSVGNTPDNLYENLVAYDSIKEASINSIYMSNNSKIDGYVQTQETPAYATSFLLTGLLSPDYVDVNGDGITEDDLGTAVKFDYTKSADSHRWRTPRKNNGGNNVLASFNEGLRSEKRDNKAIISYGERESWYLNAIESKSMVAIFKTESRNDAKGVKSAFDGSVNANENANKRLSRIDLYTKAEIKAKGIVNAKPLKSVWFDYGYGLCTGTPDNNNASEGKLTLRSIYFTYNGQVKNNKERYVFNYGDTTSIGSVDDPNYAYNSADRWGTYKKSTQNPNLLSNINYPYTDTSKIKSGGYAAAWSLKKILLPSGGQMEVQYEADDYAYVQDRRACNMYQISGLGNSKIYSAGNALYNGGNATQDNNYVYVKLPKLLVNTDVVKRKNEIFTKYLEGINQLAFKLLVQMPKGMEPLTVYANFDDWDYSTNMAGTDIIYIKLRQVDGKSPLATAAIGFISGNLPGQAFPGYEQEINSLPDFINMAGGMLTSLSAAFTNVDGQMRGGPDGPKAKRIDLSSSFIRLNNADRNKPGGGVRVKRVTLKDNWNAMTKQYTSSYGQDYDYTTTEKVDGMDMVISSGVASYEPGIGSEENPFREIESVKNKLPLASAQYGAIEMPVLEGFYPSPLVGYSKVTVRSINRKSTQGSMSVRSAIGKQVTEFFTAREYPSYSVFTPLIPDKSSFDYNKNPFFSFLYKEIINRRTLSQGFLVETNDMHGKMKSQAAYSESDEKTPISASYHTYKNTGKNGLNDKVAFVYNDQGGVVKMGNMGIDMELMTDVREFKLESNGLNGQLQIDILFFVILNIPIPTFFPLKTYQENLYRAVTCTKLINYHAIEDSVVVMDKGSIISTKTIAYDAETGSAIVTRTANEFNDSVYNVSYPAHWAYSGTGLAYKNVGQSFSNVNFYDGKILSGVADMSVFESGDELYITTQGGGTSNCIAPSANTFKLWVFDNNKNTTALTVPSKNLVFIDSAGNPFTKNGVGFRILRSGKRNNLSLTVSSATCMKSPVQNGKLIVNNAANVVAASAAEYKEKWQTDNDVIVKKAYYIPSCSSAEQDSLDCNGIVEKKINPYLKGLVGNFKPWRTYTYYGSRVDSVVTNTTTIRKNGYISNFNNYWGFNVANNLVPDYNNTRWVWDSELKKVNSKGQELETMDALNRYTSAQYGFNKNLTVAITQNARYGEGMSEGFEDNNYVEAINRGRTTYCDNSKYSSFFGLNKSAIALDTAHSGKYSLRVNSNDSTSKFFNVKQGTIDNFSFEFKKDTTKLLNTLGGNITYVDVHPFVPADNSGNYTTPQLLWEAKTQFANGGFNVPGIIIRDTFPNGSLQRYHYFKIENTYFIDITQSGNYSFTLGYQKNEICNYTALSLQVNFVNVNTGEGTYLSMSNNSSYTYNNLPFCKGIYKVTSIIRNSLVWSLISDPINLPVALDGVFWPYSQPSGCQTMGFLEPWGWYCNNGFPDGGNNSWGYPGISMTTNAATTNYKTLSTANGCISTKPFAATDSMLNPIFTLAPSKRMQFSAWVKEGCTTPCYSTDFTKSNISILSGGVNIAAVSVKRTGAIIEGWQKVEGEFTMPANATTAEIRFINTNNQPMYVDDIRIHPFNANMKSYVYDPRTLRLAAELDENNYASFYEYDEEGQLIRVKKETIQGIKTIKETRSSKQKKIIDLQ